MRRSVHPIRCLLVGLAILLGLVAGTPRASADAPAIHVVTWGDTLVTLAARYGTSVNAVMQANGMRDANFIYVGQRLLIPGGVAPAPVPTATSYVVQPGDTLFAIANRYGTTIGALMQANRLYNYWIYVGQPLRIPGTILPPPAPQPLPPPVPIPTGLYYIVQPGDYLALIAARYGTSIFAIQIANRISNPSLIYAGQRLFIPGGQAPMNPPPPIAVPVPPIAPPYVPPYVAPVIPIPVAPTWEGVVLSNTAGTGPCSLAVTVVGKTDWPVVLASVDNGTVTDAKLTGTKPERGPYVVEFAQSCTGIWRVIPIGLGAIVDVKMQGGHAEVEFHQRAN